MKNLLKTSLGCLFIALAMNVAWTQVVAPGVIFGEETPWLKMYLVKDAGSFEPQSVVVYSAAYPQVDQVSPGVWKITFRKTF